MKVTFELDLNKERDRYNHKAISQAVEMRSAIDDFLQLLRSCYKYEQSLDDLIDITAQIEMADKIKIIFMDCLRERGVDLDD